ncbi:MAG: ATP-dependent helicase HrpB, partial [Planctomycetaceae bacterium]
MGTREPLVPLPVDDVLPELLQQLRGSGCVVLQAPTGSGKTTRVASAILSSGLADLADQPGRGQVVMLEPRRVAARAAARRIAWERGVSLGAEVGYQVRF